MPIRSQGIRGSSHQLVQPQIGGAFYGNIDPAYRWFWEKDIRVCAPFWDGTGDVLDLSRYEHHGTLGNGAVWSTDEYGHVIDFGTTAQGRAVDFGSAATLDNLTPLTLVVLVQVRSTNWPDNDQRILQKSAGVGTSGWRLMPWDGDSGLTGSPDDCFAWLDDSGGGTRWAVHSPEGSMVLDQWQVVGAELRTAVSSSVPDNATGKNIWVDGVNDPTHDNSGSPTRLSDADDDMIAGEQTVAGADEPLDGMIGGIYVLKDTLSHAEHELLARDFYGPVRPYRRLPGQRKHVLPMRGRR